MHAVRGFSAFGTATREWHEAGIPYLVNEFWTAGQRRAHSLHEISFRACFKPQLPEFFIGRLTEPGDAVYDPFMGRGTTPVQAALMGRRPVGNDVNPLSVLLARPRLAPPTAAQVAQRLREVPWDAGGIEREDLLAFYHPDTLRRLCALRRWLLDRAPLDRTAPDPVDDWIRMVALNRLTGHSPGFFSVYTLPPNQAVSVAAQRKINADRGQVPPPRDVAAILLKKTRSLLRDGPPPSPQGRSSIGCPTIHRVARRRAPDEAIRPPRDGLLGHCSRNALRPGPSGTDRPRGDRAGSLGEASASPEKADPEGSEVCEGRQAHPPALLGVGLAAGTPYIPGGSVALVVTSPPFLDTVQYAADNWLRCWFAGIDVDAVALAMHRGETAWTTMVRDVLVEQARVLRPGGHVAFEVGEVRGGKVLLERLVWAAAEGLPFERLAVLVNQQSFTKTAHCWGVSNNAAGTNTNRIVLLRRVASA